MKHIELFAGCGGMSLGLEAAGYELYFANELSPMAGETFAFNLLGEDLNNPELNHKALWIKSQFPNSERTQRLRENPSEASAGEYSDIDANTNFKEKLLIGDINQLLEFFQENPATAQAIQDEGIDLMSGGPPCQSFSLAGKREKNNHKNTLPLSFVNLVSLIRPKVVLLENVKGITAPFTEDGSKYYAWLEVSKAFALDGYVPVCMMLNSKYFGVAQNRPRFILIAYRLDIFQQISALHYSNTILSNSWKFYQRVDTNRINLELVTIKDLNLYDIETSPELFDGEVLPKTSHPKGQFVNASQAIGDIRKTNVPHDISNVTYGYGKVVNETFPKRNLPHPYFIKNHETRSHGFNVKARFRFYQVINEFQNGLRQSAVDLFTGKEIDEEKLKRLFVEFSQYNLYFRDENDEYYKHPKEIAEVKELIKNIPTKKHSQRALKEFEPAPAQLTVPDDLCHYHMENLRTMTVREMARFQSFPDWFEFRSKVTTGGWMRKYEVPQYTQVGNAVPPLLAKALGDLLKKQFEAINNGTIQED